jgi:RHS repeat-associated protein
MVSGGPEGGGASGGGSGGGGLLSATGARVAATAKSLEVKDTGNAKLDAMGDVFNNALAPFENAPPPEQGAIGVVNHAIGAVMGIQNVGMELMNTGFAMATASIAAALPSFPAAFLTVPHLGTPHAHAHPPSLIPPAPPVPLPSIGTLMCAGAVGVLICGMPAGRCGDIGLAVTCGSLAPAFDVFLGSSNTFIAGNRAARMTDITRHCNPASAALAVSRGAALFNAAVGAVGVLASAAGGEPIAGAVAQIAADLAAAAMSALLGKDPGIPPSMGALMLGAPTVLIGGFPCPNLPNPLDALMHALKCLGKAFMGLKAVGKLLSKLGLCNAPGEPIEPATGVVFNEFVEWEDHETGFAWGRHYRSDWNTTDGPLGFGHRHFYQQRLTLLRKRAVYESHDGEMVALARLADDGYAPIAGHSLERKGIKHFRLQTDRDEIIDFEIVPGTIPEAARLTRYQKGKVEVLAYYDNRGRLYALSQYVALASIDTRFSYDAQGRIVEVERGARDGAALTIARYTYENGCIATWQDALGATGRFTYGPDRRMTTMTDRRGYGFHWQYDPTNGRCSRSYGDDRLWGVEATYQGSQSVFKEEDGGVWLFKHYPDGRISHLVDPCGGVLQYVEGDGGRIVKQVEPGGREYDWLYDASGKHYARRDPWGNEVPPEDAVPNPPDPHRHNGPETQVALLFGRPLVERPPAPGRALPVAVALAIGVDGSSRAPTAPKLRRDALGQLVERTYPDGSGEWLTRDGEGNVVAHRDTGGGTYRYEITSWNLVGAEETPLGHVTRYQHTHREHVTVIVDPNGNRTEYQRDKRQRVAEIVENGVPYLRYEYDAHDHIVEERNGEGALLVTHEMNAAGQTIETALSTGEKYSFGYDTRGGLAKASSSRHEVLQRRRGIVITSDLRDGTGVEHDYDEEIELVESTYFDRFVVHYDVSSGRTVRVQTPDGAEHLFYRPESDVLVRENGNGTREAVVHDDRGRVTARVCWKDPDASRGATWATRYHFNAAGELVRVFDTENGLVEHFYDADHRLIGLHTNGTKLEYRYDGAGNLTYAPEHLALERLPSNHVAFSRLEHFEYDDRHRLSKRVGPGGVTTSYVYDDLDQLVEVRWSDREEVWRAGYDGLGRRLYVRYGDCRTEFYWDKDRLAAEIGADGRVRLYVYANEDALVPFCFLDYDNLEAEPKSAKVYYLFANGTGMPIRVEDANGTTVWRAEAIAAYGDVRVAGGAAIDLRLRFAGHFYDEHLGLYYNRFRDYDPKLCRYLQPDPLGHAGSSNVYAYPWNPVVDVDLRGQMHGKKGKQKSDGKEGDGRGSKEAKEKLEQGEVDSYHEQKKKAAQSEGLERDHIPSKAAVQKAIEERLGRELSDSEVRNLHNNLTTAAIDKETHEEGRTHGNKNKELIDGDSKDLNKAANKDLDAHRDNLKEDGMSKKEVSTMEKEVHDRNEKLGLYDKPLDKGKMGNLLKPPK